MNKVIVAHPGSQHSFRLAEALQKAGMLDAYITTVYNRPQAKWMAMVNHFIKAKDAQRALKRCCDALPDEKIIQFCEFTGLLLLLIVRIDKSRKIYRWLNSYVSNSFGKKVARYAVRNQADAVICYDTASTTCFRYLKRNNPSIIRIIDNAAANRYYSFCFYQNIKDDYENYNEIFSMKPYLISREIACTYREEALLADKHIVASTFARNSITYCGVDPKDVYIIPYGIDQNRFPSRGKYKSCFPLKVLYVGEVTPNKGIMQLTEAAERLLGKGVEFHIAGGGLDKLRDVNLKERIENSIICHGYLLPAELDKVYEECDIFAFPSLSDGFGLVLLEAMKAGMPTIASVNSAGPDVIVDQVNGFLIPAEDAQSLIEKIEFFRENPKMLEQMGREAYRSASAFTWEKYGAAVVDALKDIIARERSQKA